MITLRWAPFPGADVAKYRVYRSIVGFRAILADASALGGLTLVLQMNGTPPQSIYFDAVSPVVDNINAQISGGHAYPSQADAGYFLVRSDIRTAPGAVTIVGGTALSLLGLSPRTITEKYENVLIKELDALEDPNTLVEFIDLDGACQDWYAISTVDSQGNESLKSPFKQPVTHTGQLCVIEGIVTDLQGIRIPDAEVTATLVKFPHQSELASQVTLEPLKTLTGPDGRFSLTLLQGALVEIDIPAVGLSRNITVPSKAYEFITELPVDLDYRYPLEYR